MSPSRTSCKWLTQQFKRQAQSVVFNSVTGGTGPVLFTCLQSVCLKIRFNLSVKDAGADQKTNQIAGNWSHKRKNGKISLSATLGSFELTFTVRYHSAFVIVVCWALQAFKYTFTQIGFSNVGGANSLQSKQQGVRNHQKELHLISISLVFSLSHYYLFG